MDSMREYNVLFEGLKIGQHKYNFELSDTFFDSIEDSIVNKGNIKISLLLDKRETMMVAHFLIKGNVTKPCDRCNDDVSVSIKSENQIIYKFGGVSNEDENLIVLEPSQYQLILGPVFYELIVVSLPLRSIHKEGQCNQQMLALLAKYSTSNGVNENTEADPRWDALKGLN
jgi:uncharacterized protein